MQGAAARALDDGEGQWFAAGAAAALGIAAGYVVIIGLYVPMGAPPSGPEERLAYIAGHTRAWWGILWLSVLTDVLFLPVAGALYVALRAVNRNLMLVSAACVALFVVLDLAITWTNYAALIALSEAYSRAATEAQKMAAVTAARYPAAVLESSLLFVYNTLTLAIGILLSGWVMLTGKFGRAAAYLGLATGILGIVSVAGPPLYSSLSAAIIFTSLLTTVWLGVVGWQLLRYGKTP